MQLRHPMQLHDEQLPVQVPWVGVPGQVFVQRILSKMDPKTAVARIQQQGGLIHPGCGPLLGLLDALGCTRQGLTLQGHQCLLKGMQLHASTSVCQSCCLSPFSCQRLNLFAAGFCAA